MLGAEFLPFRSLSTLVIAEIAWSIFGQKLCRVRMRGYSIWYAKCCLVWSIDRPDCS